MTYVLPSVIYIFILGCLSYFAKNLLKISISLSLVSIFALLSLTTLLLTKIVNIQIYFIFTPLIVLCFFTIYKNKDLFLDINIQRFFLYSCLIMFICHNKYFLDEDELTFWGINSKYFFGLSLYEDNVNLINQLYNLKYHSLLLPSFKSILTNFFSLREDFLIFCNNLIILILFFSLFQTKKNNFYFQLVYFILFYFLLNLFSFGLNSIYADVIVITLAALIYREIVLKHFIFKYNLKTLNIFILLMLLILTHRIGLLFFFIIIMNYILLNKKYYISNKLDLYLLVITLLIVTLILFIYPHPQLFYITQLESLNLENKNLLYEFFFYTRNLFLYDTQYIKLFSLPNDVINFLKLGKGLPIYNIKVYHIFILYFLINVIFFKNSQYLYLSLFTFLIFLFVTFFTKIILESNLHPYATVRYIMLYFLFDFVIKLSIKFNSNKQKRFSILMLVILLFFTPSKSVGFFLPKKIYLQDKKNNDYYLFVEQLREIKKKYEPQFQLNEIKFYEPQFQLNEIKFYLVEDSLTSLQISRIIYEFYPHISKFRYGNAVTIFPKENFEKMKFSEGFLHVVLSKYNLIKTKENIIIEKF